MCSSIVKMSGVLGTLTAIALASSAWAAPDPGLQAAISDSARSANFVARDPARHPAEELEFFGLKPTMAVVELWPGGGYWSEILAPYLAKGGTYYVAIEPSAGAESTEGNAKWHADMIRIKDKTGTVHETALGKGQFEIAPAGSADLILTFRNLHNWMDGGYADEALAACFKALKPGGILGIEDHRGSNTKPQDPKAKDGYVRQDYAIALAKKAGFVLVASSEIDANPKDTKDWVDGVWTLPPSYSQGDKDRAKYQAIGEADNFVLKFRKPKT
jgi:predicted methyltransferase